jgi:hypothetical protein
MSGGKIILDDDLIFADDRTLTGSGTVELNNKRVAFGSSDMVLTHTILWRDATDIQINAKTYLSGQWIIRVQVPKMKHI